jgi:hypothetical protein
MQTTTASHALAGFRRTIYDRCLGRRKDSLFELTDAVLASPGPETLARLSLAPVFRRRWASAADALAEGEVGPAACRRLAQATLAAQPVAGRPIWAVDGTVWPRPWAATVSERTHGYQARPGQPQKGLVPAWEYPWLAAVPEAGGSWVLPLDVARRRPGGGSPTALALGQLRAALAARPAGAPRPVVTFDSGYDVVALARAGLDCDLLVRLPKRRRFYRPPPAYRGRGRRPVHGPVFKTFDPATHGAPDRTALVEDPDHGTVRVDVWAGLHDQAAHAVPLAIVRVTVARLPRSGKAPQPLWLAWHGGPPPADLLDLWRWYRRRFVIEHGFRFLKHDLGWTTARPADPAAADRWSWLLALACWELYLARAHVADRRLPWERAGPPHRLTPGRVRRAIGPLLAALGTPAAPPRRRGNAPGRRPGDRPGRRPRQPVVKRRPAAA